MKTIFRVSAILLAAISPTMALAQQTPAGTVSKFVRYYHSGRADSAYLLFSDRLRSAMSYEDTNILLEKLTVQLGRITAQQPEPAAKDTKMAYRLQFERPLVDMALIMDGDRIDGIRKRLPEKRTSPAKKQ